MVAAVATWVANNVLAVAAPYIGSAAAEVALYNVVYYGTQAAIYAGASYAANAALTDTPSSDAAQGSIKQTLPPRIVAYGRGKLPGQYMLWEAKENYAYDVCAVHWGRSEAIEEIWSHDHKLNFVGGGSSGWVAYSADYGGGDSDLIHVDLRLGLPMETAYSAIVAALGPSGVWTSAHRGDGITSIGADYHHGKKENLLSDFPNGDPSWSTVGRWSLIWDPRTDSHSASRNTAIQILDLLTRADGFNESFDDTIAPVLDHWMAQMDICDEAIPQKAGGTAPRYESFVYRALSDDPQECLNKLLTACDGRLLMDQDGRWKLWVGKYQEPTVILTEEDIVGYDIAGDASAEDVVNELVPSFKSEAHKWNMVATDPWQDSVDAEARGKIMSSPMDLEAVTNNSQARRLAKREMSRLRSPMRGRLGCKLSADRACGERWIRVDFPELDMADTVIEVEDGGQTAFSSLTVTIPFFVADPNADAWNPATEEGDGPQLSDRIDRESLTAPEIVSLEIFQDSIGDTTGPRLRITGAGPDRGDLAWAARWRVTGSSSWVEGTYVDIDPGTPVLLETGFVAAEDLQVQIAYTTGGGALSPWSATQATDATNPDAVDTALSALLNQMTVQPNATRRGHMRTLIASLMEDGVWNKMPLLYVMAAHDAQAARVNWKAPGSFTLTASGDPAFTPNQGYQGDGVDAWLDTGCLASGLPGASPSSLHIGAWSTLDPDGDTAGLIGTASGNTLRILQSASGTFNTRVSDSTSTTSPGAAAVGHLVATRTGSAKRGYINGALVQDASVAPAASLPAANISLLMHNATLFSKRRLAFAHAGPGLTSAEVGAIRDAFSAYLSAVS